jgi:hypothetical protein
MDIADLLFKAEQRGFRRNFANEDLEPEGPATQQARIVYSQAVDQGTDPGDDATLYLIEAADGQKGYLIVGDAFRTDPHKAALIDHLARRRDH